MGSTRSGFSMSCARSMERFTRPVLRAASATTVKSILIHTGTEPLNGLVGRWADECKSDDYTDNDYELAVRPSLLLACVF